MKLYMKRKNKSVDAIMDHSVEDGQFVVLKGSKVAELLSNSTTFRGFDSVKKSRGNGVVIDGIVQQDMVFKSASTAANFVTGTSTNGLIAWKNEDGVTLKEILQKGEE